MAKQISSSRLSLKKFNTFDVVSMTQYDCWEDYRSGAGPFYSLIQIFPEALHSQA